MCQKTVNYGLLMGFTIWGIRFLIYPVNNHLIKKPPFNSIEKGCCNNNQIIKFEICAAGHNMQKVKWNCECWSSLQGSTEFNFVWQLPYWGSRPGLNSSCIHLVHRNITNSSWFIRFVSQVSPFEVFEASQGVVSDTHPQNLYVEC